MNSNEKVIADTIREVLGELSRAGGFPAAGGANAAGSRICAGPLSRISHTTANITLDCAERLMKQVEAKAGEMGMKVVTAVADAHGDPVAVRCMDGAFMGSYDVALHKTYTAIAFQMSTEELGRLSQPGAPLYGIQYTNQGKIVIFGGGIPLRADGEIIGAFGVSGGTAEQDTYLADYAGECFRRMIG